MRWHCFVIKQAIVCFDRIAEVIGNRKSHLHIIHPSLLFTSTFFLYSLFLPNFSLNLYAVVIRVVAFIHLLTGCACRRVWCGKIFSYSTVYSGNFIRFFLLVYTGFYYLSFLKLFFLHRFYWTFFISLHSYTGQHCSFILENGLVDFPHCNSFII